jgi:hypothetical protein
LVQRQRVHDLKLDELASNCQQKQKSQQKLISDFDKNYICNYFFDALLNLFVCRNWKGIGSIHYYNSGSMENIIIQILFSLLGSFG